MREAVANRTCPARLQRLLEELQAAGGEGKVAAQVLIATQAHFGAGHRPDASETWDVSAPPPGGHVAQGFQDIPQEASWATT